MKKLLFTIGIAASLSMMSCGGNASSSEETNNVDSLAIAIEQELNSASDSASVAGVINEMQSTLQELEASGDTAAVSAYKWKIKQLINSNKEKLSNLNAVELINEVSDFKGLIQEVKDAATSDATQAKEEAIDAAKTAVENNEDVQKAKAAVEDVKQKAEEAAKTAEEIKKAGEAAKNALKGLKRE